MSLGVTTNYTKEQELLSSEILNDIADYIKIELGAPMVDVEIPDQVILKNVELALRKLSRYNLVVLWHTVTAVNNRVDLSKFPHRVSYIVDVLSSSGNSITGMNALSNIFGIPAGIKISTVNSMGAPFTSISDLTSVLAESVIMSRNLNAYKDGCSIDFDYVNNYLYVDMSTSMNSNITIEYVPVLTIYDLYLLARDQTSYDILLKYAAGLCKISLGRARGKYSMSGYDYSLSSDELLSSGKSEIESLDNELKLNYSHIILD